MGEDVENILLRLIQAADGDIAQGGAGHLYIDEIDKISRKSPNPSITRDVSGKACSSPCSKLSRAASLTCLHRVGQAPAPGVSADTHRQHSVYVRRRVRRAG